jgi:hypothetical protein
MPSADLPAGVYRHDGENILAYYLQETGTGTFRIHLIVKQTTQNYWAGFQNILIDPSSCEVGEGACQFPSINNQWTPECVEEFINKQHPQPGYQHLNIMFYVFQDIEKIVPGSGKIPLRNGDWGQFFIWNRQYCDDSAVRNPHTVDATFVTSDDGQAGDPNAGFFIERKDAQTWTITVSQQKFQVVESYCKVEPYIGKNGKTIYINKLYTPFKGWAYNNTFTLDLIKSVQ